MISTLHGVLADRSGETVVVETDGGVGYEIIVPLGVQERLPAVGSRCTLHTELVVREDSWTLYGFDSVAERTIFRRLLGASGFGPRLAVSLLSALGPERTVRSIQGRDVAALSTVSGIGKKKAERLILELHDRFKELTVPKGDGPAPAADAALRALESLGYSTQEASAAIREALKQGITGDLEGVIRQALQHLATAKRGI